MPHADEQGERPRAAGTRPRLPRVVLLAGLLGLLVVAGVAGVVPTQALAQRRASGPERTAILRAVVRQHQLSRAQAACQRVTISTVSPDYAELAWPQTLSSACRRVAANGVIIERRTRSGWHLVTAGSALTCPIRGVPIRVAHDLRLCA